MARLPLMLCLPLAGCIWPHPCACEEEGQAPYSRVYIQADAPLALDDWTCEAMLLARESLQEEPISGYAAPALWVEIVRMDDGEKMAYEIPLNSSLAGYHLPSDARLGGFEGCTFGLNVTLSLLAPEACEDDVPAGYETVGLQLRAEDDEPQEVTLWDDWVLEVEWLRNLGMCMLDRRPGPRGHHRR